jgi:pyridoxamine 5'-phosphate oxidase
MLSNSLVEVCFWIEPTQEQFRFSSRVTIVPAPSSSLYTPATATLADLANGKFGEGEVDWEKKRLEMFDAMSGHMKASWVRPPPGSKMPGSGGYDEAKKWTEKLPKRGEEGSEKEKKELEEALGNFALMVIEPYEVDYVELGVVPNQRTRFVRNGDEWEEEILVP